MSGGEFLKSMLDSGARPFECQDCGVVHWLSQNDRLAIEREARGIPPDASADLREAAMYALGFMNDPEGLAEKREEWRDNLRAALHAEAQSIPRPSYPTPEEFAAMSQEQFVAFLDRIGVRRGIPLIDVELLRKRIPRPPTHVHEYGCGHAGEGITPEYQRGWSAGRAHANEQVHVILDELAGIPVEEGERPSESYEQKQQRLRREEEDRL